MEKEQYEHLKENLTPKQRKALALIVDCHRQKKAITVNTIWPEIFSNQPVAVICLKRLVIFKMLKMTNTGFEFNTDECKTQWEM